MQLVDNPAKKAAGHGTHVNSIDELAGLDCQQLERLFGTSRWQPGLRLEGHPRGRLLAVPGLDHGLAARGLAQYAAGPLMIWQGKSFRGGEAGEGEGMNRVWLGTRFSAFRFRTYVTASKVDGQPSFAIDYDLPKNSALVRGVYDELRPVGPGVFLGRGMRRTRSGVQLLVWFGLDANHQDGALPF